MPPVHITHWGPAITTSQIGEESARVRVRTEIVNESGKSQPLTLHTRILDARGEVVAETKSVPYTSGRFDQTLTVSKPALWSTDNPNLYRVSQQVWTQDRMVDERVTSFGIRTIDCDSQEGFKLNGRPILLKGLCMHHDNYMLGAAAYPRAEERRVEIVKAAGYNAVRCSHNPPSSAFLDACDRLGLLVIDEAFDQWARKKNRQDYHLYFNDWWQRDLAGMILRDRNHPSVVMWSIGNEIPEQRSQDGADITAKMVALIKSLDDSRPVTIGANMAGEQGDPLFAHLDLAGYNYQLDHHVSDHNRVPDRVMYASESFVKDAFDYWEPVETLPHYIGDFVWTGYDYLGEASIGWHGYTQGWKSLGPYPWHLAYCGEIDALGIKRPAAYYRDVLWKTGSNPISAFVKSPEFSLSDYEPNNIQFWLHPDVHASWTWPGCEGRELEVVIYSVYEEVELLLNGRGLGKQKITRDAKYTATYRVPYVPGELKAVGYQNGQPRESWTLKTAGASDKILLIPDRKKIHADGRDLVYVTVEVTDADGVLVPWADDLIHFEIKGPGVLAGVGNGNPRSTESFQQLRRTAFRGRCMAVIRSRDESGIIELTAKAEGLKSDKVVIRTEPR
jgi:beta-galactosidase